MDDTEGERHDYRVTDDGFELWTDEDGVHHFVVGAFHLMNHDGRFTPDEFDSTNNARRER